MNHESAKGVPSLVLAGKTKYALEKIVAALEAGETVETNCPHVREILERLEIQYEPEQLRVLT